MEGAAQPAAVAAAGPTGRLIIGGSALVVLVVIGVLTLLIRLVQDIDQGVDGVVETLGQTARNTGQSFLIADIRGYTRFTLERGDEAAARLVRRFAAIRRSCPPPLY